MCLYWNGIVILFRHSSMSREICARLKPGCSIVYDLLWHTYTLVKAFFHHFDVENDKWKPYSSIRQQQSPFTNPRRRASNWRRLIESEIKGRLLVASNTELFQWTYCLRGETISTLGEILSVSNAEQSLDEWRSCDSVAQCT